MRCSKCSALFRWVVAVALSVAPLVASAQDKIETVRTITASGIAAHRTGDLRLSISVGGAKASGAKVEVEQKKHDYRFGTGVDRKQVNNSKYWDIVRKNYNYTVETNAMKWRNWDKSLANTMYNKSVSAGLPMRGHCIFWGRDNMDKRSASGETLKKQMQARVKEAVGAFKGRITEWDFNNEMINNFGGLADMYSKQFGDGIIHDMFKWTHDIDPDIMMYFNEFGCEGEKDKAKHYYALIKKFIDRGLPKNKMGIGLQAHMSDDPRKGENLQVAYLMQCLNTMAQLGLPILATEFDYDNPNDSKRADGLETFYRVWFSHPSTVGIIQWGFWDGENWKPESALWKGSGFSETEVARRYKKLVWEEWWTRASKNADANGEAGLDVYYGTHAITVTHGGKTASFTLTWPKGGKPTLDKSESNGIRLTAVTGGGATALRRLEAEQNVLTARRGSLMYTGSGDLAARPLGNLPGLRVTDVIGRTTPSFTTFESGEGHDAAGMRILRLR